MQSAGEERPPGLKPTGISQGLRGPEGPLFHGDARILHGTHAFFTGTHAFVSSSASFEAVPYPEPARTRILAVRDGQAPSLHDLFLLPRPPPPPPEWPPP